jgi:hypothetical protein
VILKATYHFTDHGKAMNEPARMTFALHRTADGWKILGWTWTGPRPTPDAKP